MTVSPGCTRIRADAPARGNSLMILSRMFAAGETGVQVIGEMPIQQHARKHAALMQEAMLQLAQIRDISGGHSALGKIAIRKA